MLRLELHEKASPGTGVTNHRPEHLMGRGFKIRTQSMRRCKRTDHRLRFLNLALALDERNQHKGRLYLL